MAKSCLLFLLLAGLCLSVQAQKKTISVIGSSTAAGYGLPDAEGNPVLSTDGSENDKPVNSWVNRLRRYYTTLNLLNELDNFAIWGEDLYQAMPDGYTPPDGRNWQDPTNNISNALTVNPDIILINFPTNGYDVQDVDEIMARLHDLYNTATANGHTLCYVCTTQPRTSEGWDPDVVGPEQALANRQKLTTLKDRILSEFPGHAIDFYTPVVDMSLVTPTGDPNLNYLGILPQYAQGDGTHLNEDGHNVLFQQVLAKNIIPFGNLPLSVGKISVKRIDDTHITVSFTVYPNNTEKQFFIQIKDKAGKTKQVRVIIPDKTKDSQTVSETIQIY